MEKVATVSYNRWMRVSLLIFNTLLTILFLKPLVTLAQDERYLREIFSGMYVPLDKKIDQRPIAYKWRANGAIYQLDLDGDGFKELLIPEMIDGQNWLNIYSPGHLPHGSFHFEAQGANSHIYKIIFRSVATNIKVLLVHFYEGYSQYYQFAGQSRLYIITIVDNKLNEMKITKGPVFYYEVEEQWGKKAYYQREYFLNTYDYNNDGIDEISLKYRTSSYVYHYADNGLWATYRPRSR